MKKLILLGLGTLLLSMQVLADPPGLVNKGNHPRGLESHGKTPYGWSQGKKKGWNHRHHRHHHNHRHHGHQGQKH